VYHLTAAATENYDRDQNDDPAIVIAEERIKTAHSKSSFLSLKHYVMGFKFVNISRFVFPARGVGWIFSLPYHRGDALGSNYNLTPRR
jgi:hypothetical protein